MQCHPVYLTYMQSTSCQMLDQMKTQAEINIAQRNKNTLRYAGDATLRQKAKKN